MNREEYSIMARVEDAHWWYAGLRGMIRAHWARYGTEGSRILDVGCGTGANAQMLSKFGDVVGLDISPEALVFSRGRGLRDLERAGLPHLPHPDEAFDAALLMDVLYHRAVPHKAEALREVCRVLKPGGIVLINVPAYEWLRSSHDRAIHTDHRFTRGEMVVLLEEAGFEIERATYWNSILFPAVVAVRLLRKFSDAETSDLDGYTSGISGMLFGLLLKFERGLMRHFPLPLGTSIFVVARKAD